MSSQCTLSRKCLKRRVPIWRTMVRAKNHDFQFGLKPEPDKSYHEQSSDVLKQLAADAAVLSSLTYKVPAGSEGRTIDLLKELVKTRPAVNAKSGGPKRLTLAQPENSWFDLVNKNRDILQKCTFVEVYIDNNDNVMLVVRYKGLLKTEVLIVAHRGTNSVADLITDLKFQHCEFDPQIEMTRRGVYASGMKVHKGFARSLKEVNATLDIYLKPINFFGPVLFTGHSKGGAVAQLAALQTALTLDSLRSITGVGCITFGCPHVGNKAFCDAYNEHVQVRLQLKNGRDPVVHLPPLSLHPLHSYAGIGNRIHVGPKESRWSWKFSLFCIPDHDITWYIHYMKANDDDGDVGQRERVRRLKSYAQGKGTPPDLEDSRPKSSSSTDSTASFPKLSAGPTRSSEGPNALAPPSAARRGLLPRYTGNGASARSSPRPPSRPASSGDGALPRSSPRPPSRHAGSGDGALPGSSPRPPSRPAGSGDGASARSSPRLPSRPASSRDGAPARSSPRPPSRRASSGPGCSTREASVWYF